MVLVVKNLPVSAGDVRDVGSIPGWEDLLEEGMATHSSILAWRMPWTEEPGRLQSRGSQKVGHDWNNFSMAYSHTQPWGNLDLGVVSVTKLLKMPGISPPSGPSWHIPPRLSQSYWSPFLDMFNHRTLLCHLLIPFGSFIQFWGSGMWTWRGSCSD